MYYLFITCSYQFHFLLKRLINLFLYIDIKKGGKKETIESFYSNFSCAIFNYLMQQEFKSEFLQPFLHVENSYLLIVNIENQDNTVKYYKGNTFVDSTHCCFRHTKTVTTKRKWLIMYEKQEKKRGITMFTTQLYFCLLLWLIKGKQVTIR